MQRNPKNLKAVCETVTPIGAPTLFSRSDAATLNRSFNQFLVTAAMRHHCQASMAKVSLQFLSQNTATKPQPILQQRAVMATLYRATTPLQQ